MPNKTEIRCFKRWLYLKEGGQTTPNQGTEVQAVQIANDFIGLVNQESSLTISKHISCTQWTNDEDQILKEKVL